MSTRMDLPGAQQDPARRARGLTPVLALITAVALAACADGSPTAPHRMEPPATCTLAATLTVDPATTWTAVEVEPVLADAADRPSESLGTDAASKAVVKAMYNLAASWNTDPTSSCLAVNHAASALAQLPANPATDADRAAMQLAVQLAADVLSAGMPATQVAQQ